MAADPQALKALEAEAAKYEKEDDLLSALDVYEEIVRKGWAGGAHLLALGQCYLKNRQRQNAKTAWVRGIEIEPGNAKLRETLDHYFPGWETAGAATQVSGPAAVVPPPPAKKPGPQAYTDSAPPPPPRFADPSASTIVVETSSTETRRPKAPPPSEPRPAPRPEPAAPAMRRETRSEDTIRAVRQHDQGARVERSGEARVNWQFVYEDAAEGLVSA